MSRYQAYPVYVDSGVSWIGNIPEGWGMWKISHAFQEIGSGTTPSSLSDDLYDGDIPWVTTGELRESLIIDTQKKIKHAALIKYPTLKKYPVGSIAIAMYGATIGRLGVFGIEATTNQACCVMTKSSVIDNSYLFYWLQAFRKEIINLSSGGGQPNINQEKVASLKVSAPNSRTQRSIVAFLDHETAKIDTLIDKQQQLIKLLKEKRQAVISHAVTKGLNPDAPMKDSGVEWLGEVPEHWVVCSLKHIKSKLPNAFVDGPFGSNLKSEHFIENGDVYVIESNFATTGNLNISKLKTISKKHFETISRSEAKQNDIILAKIGARYGYSSILPEIDKRAVVSGNSLKLTVDQEVCDTVFVSKLLQHLKQDGAMDDGVNVTAQPALSLGALNNLPFVVPPITEQKCIVENLSKRLDKIDSTVSRAEKMIVLMQERRTALISAAVTGKIDVRNFKADDANVA